MSLPSAVHVSSTFECGAPRMSLPSAFRQFSILHCYSETHECHCLALFMCPPLSSAEPLVTGKYVFLLFSGSVPLPSMCICVYVYNIRCSCCCLFFVLCCTAKKRSRDENRHHGKGRMDEISVLSLLSSYLR